MVWQRPADFCCGPPQVMEVQPEVRLCTVTEGLTEDAVSARLFQGEQQSPHPVSTTSPAVQQELWQQTEPVLQDGPSQGTMHTPCDFSVCPSPFSSYPCLAPSAVAPLRLHLPSP